MRETVQEHIHGKVARRPDITTTQTQATKEEQYKWFAHYERSIIKNKILRHYSHLDVAYIHANREHIQAVRDAKSDITISNKCLHLLTLKYFI
jgi:hypothetical protein